MGVRCGQEHCGLGEGPRVPNPTQRSEDSLLWGCCSPSHAQAPLRVENMSHPKPGEAGRVRLRRRPKADSLLWNITHLLLGTEVFSGPLATSHPAPGPHGGGPLCATFCRGKRDQARLPRPEGPFLSCQRHSKKDVSPGKRRLRGGRGCGGI